MKKAFTLIELLVVIGILAILMGVLVATIGNGTEAARAARCLTNMRSLATACNTVAAARDYYPFAGSLEIKKINLSGGSGDSNRFFEEAKGWISWNSRGSYTGGRSTSHVSSLSWFTSAYCDDVETRQYALTNGMIWSAVSGNTDLYVCPSHRKALRHKNPLWSYVMNERFGYDDTLGSNGKMNWPGVWYGKLGRADRTLMFGELQFAPNDKLEVNTDPSAGIKNDCTLQYKHNETLGCNHPSGKRGLCAHVAFADGHVEKLAIPARRNKDSWSLLVSRGDIEDLTEWLCQGNDVSYNGSKYEKLNN
jgi:prepilin-type N-terminal cleavage/methylation domain-containing protein/prepilin-type processing-associated H-X9-DG protein